MAVQGIAHRKGRTSFEDLLIVENQQKHMRLTQDQFDDLVDLFHNWRVNLAMGKGVLREATSAKRLNTFLHYLSLLVSQSKQSNAVHGL